jgi:type II secretion system protein N
MRQLLKGETVGKKIPIYYTSVVLWGFLVFVLCIFLFFPYQKVLRITLQNLLGMLRAAVVMEEVSSKPFGIKASRLLVQTNPNAARKPLVLTNIDITWSWSSLLLGKLNIQSKASLYGGSLESLIDGFCLRGQSDPVILLTLRAINVSSIPEGTIPLLPGMTGNLSGTIKKKPNPMSANKQSGSFSVSLNDGEIRDFQIKGLPRLVFPYQTISAEGNIDGSSADISKIILKSEAISFNGSGTIDLADEQGMNIGLSYQVFSKSFPLKGHGNLRITGSPTLPVAVILNSEKVITKNADRLTLKDSSSEPIGK